MKYKDEHIHNMMKELAPKAEIKLLRERNGKRLDCKSFVTITANGNYGWMQLRELENTHRRFGHPGVMEKISKFLSGALGVDQIKQGVYDENALSEYKKRKIGRRAETLEFAMKSAGSSDREIYEALKYA